MKKIILVTVTFLAIFAPNVALSQPPSQNLTDEEKSLIRSYVCTEEDYTRGEVISTINSSDPSISNARRNMLADAIMAGQQISENNKASICKK